MKQSPLNILVARAEGAKQQTYFSAPAVSPSELQVSFKELLGGMERGALPSEAMELCPAAAPHACFLPRK